MSEGGLEAAVSAWLAVLDQLTHYEVLGVANHASASDVQNAFHLFSERFHPDRHRGEPPAIKDGIVRIFRRGSEAYRVLREPALRAEYDLGLATLRSRVTARPGEDPLLQSLDELCRTPGGRLHARQASRALFDGNLGEAAALLERALLVEGSNPALEERLEALRQVADLGRPPDPPPDEP